MMLAGVCVCVCVCCLVCFFVSVCGFPGEKQKEQKKHIISGGGLLISAGPQNNFNRGRLFNHRSTVVPFYPFFGKVPLLK